MSKNQDTDMVSNKNLMLKTIAMPLHKNINGNIFGGWIMSKMDIAGGILAKEISKGRVSTVCVKNINFLKPISAGDLVFCYAKCKKIGNTSITTKIEIWIKKIHSKLFGISYCSTTATFIYVAIDKYGKPRMFSIKNKKSKLK
ncbi:acyl-CoA thioester hydrolase YciA [Buchnera aphidicola]|uniref:Putative acyl-CoA thioester hydrolase n=1 Tax=Buchnera aphidicola subsp. Cinara cedri (strain Cc) TaxID=372461 RepID=Q057Q5_BUCCC|nr:acyl-CoA thioester hydrolase YciA [Buchnera aphidicola]ABJ90644.1 putative acyl-CoA thioester hydrolase [Buchnera aphidicola BCc]